MGLRQEYTYDEVMRAISEKPLKLDYPKRIGLRTYEDIFFSNLIGFSATGWLYPSWQMVLMRRVSMPVPIEPRRKMPIIIMFPR